MRNQEERMAKLIQIAKRKQQQQLKNQQQRKDQTRKRANLIGLSNIKCMDNFFFVPNTLDVFIIYSY